MSEKKKREPRSTSWVMMLYPESCNPNWYQILDDLHISFAHSPLHDKDVNADGEIKKAHYHVLLIFESLKSLDQLKEIGDKVGCAGNPQIALSVRGTVRYFVHKDNPEKYQYNESEIVTHGVNIKDLLQLSSSEAHYILSDILQFCRDNSIMDFNVLVDYALLHNTEWFDLLCERYTMFLTAYFKSKYNSSKSKDEGN